MRRVDLRAGVPTDMTLAQTARGPIEYRLTGAGPVVMILKGGHCSRATRLGHERLADYGFTVLEPSRPGYDRTPAAVGRSAQDAADAMAALLDALGIERASLVAISAAGHTGIELARRHPARIDRVSFEGATRAGLRLAPSSTLRLQLGQVTTLDPARLVREMDAATREHFLDVYRSLWSGQRFVCDLGHRSDSSKPIGQPALIMSSANDPSVPAPHAVRLAALCLENCATCARGHRPPVRHS